MIRNAEFTNIRNEFRDHLNRDIESIRSTKNVLVFADKSTNLYELSRENYQKLLHENITQTHKKAPKNAKQDIDRKTKSFVKTLKIEDRMECYSNQHAYITLKDHKENFRNNTKCRLINPSKSEVGLVSKKDLNDIIANVSCKTEVTEWRNTAAVINWFKNLSDKHKRKFIKFNIAEFYPSVSENLLNKSIA